MRNKKIYINLLIFLIGLLITMPVFASENIGYIDLSQENYYKLREELYKKEENKIELPLYNSDSSVKAFDEYIVEETLKMTDLIDISKYGYTTETVNLLADAIQQCEELFNVSNSFAYFWDGAGVITDIKFDYLLTADETSAALEEIATVTSDYLSGIKNEWNDLEKILYTNNYLCRLCEYDYTLKDTAHSIYGALVAKEPVCDGYSKAFKYLLKKVNINSILATSAEMVHAWNMVELNDNYYHIDVTWNDGMPGVGKTSYDYFLTSDEEFLTRGTGHYNWVASQYATSTIYDSMPEWDGIDNYLIYKDNYWYGLSSSAGTYSIGLRKIDLRNNTQTNIKAINTGKYLPLPPGLTTDGKLLYFTTQYNIWKMNYDGSEASIIFELPNTKTQMIYSVDYLNDKFYYDTFDIDSNGYASSETIKTNIYAPIVGIELDKTTITLLPEESYTLNVKFIPADTEGDKTITWTSSDETIATVDKNGKVTAIRNGNVTIIATSSNGIKAECNVIVSDVIIYTTLAVKEVDSKEFIIIKASSAISDVLVSDNFPVLDKNYTVEVFDGDVLKESDEKAGSKNTLIIKDSEGNIKKEFIIIVGGDINGDGLLKMYDAFQILKGSIMNSNLDTIDLLIRDFNNDGKVMMYDAFQFLKQAILG